MKMRDYIGRTVRLRRRVETNGGDVFEPGDELRVASTWRNRLMLVNPAHGPDDGRRGIRHVRIFDVELVEDQGRT